MYTSETERTPGAGRQLLGGVVHRREQIGLEPGQGRLAAGRSAGHERT